MKPLTDLKKEHILNLKLVCFDVDGVTIKKGTNIHEKENSEEQTLTITTKLLKDEVRDKLMELKKYYYVAINSGRSTIYLKDVFNDLLWENFALIGEVGIFTLAHGELIQHEKFDTRTLNKMKLIKTSLEQYAHETRILEAFEPKQFLITMHTRFDDSNIHELVKKADPEGEFDVIWSGEAFDILPKRLTKGTALKNLCKHLGIKIEDTMAIGNGNNDRPMTEAAGIGITTEPKVLTSDYHTTKAQDLGGIELIDKLLSLN